MIRNKRKRAYQEEEPVEKLLPKRKRNAVLAEKSNLPTKSPTDRNVLEKSTKQDASKQPAEQRNKKVTEERRIKEVKSVRKCGNTYEYLVKWANDDDDEEWIHRDIIIGMDPQQVIYFFQNMLCFS